MSDDERPKSGDPDEGARPLRRRRAASVVPEAEAAEAARERRRRLFTEDGGSGERREGGDRRGGGADRRAEPEGVKRRWRWFRRSDDRAAVSPDLRETEERAEAARAAAASLRRSRPRAESEPAARAASEEPAGRADSEPAARAESEEPAARADREPAAPRRAVTAPGKLAAGKSTERAAPPRRRRGTTEMLPPPAWHRHDLLVVAVALVLLAAGVVLQRSLSAPALVQLDQLGLGLDRPAAWLPARRIGPPSAGLATRVGSEPAAGTPAGTLPYHVDYQSPADPTARLEIRITERPTSGSLRNALALGRVARYGEAHWAAESSDQTIGGRDWTRTRYRYAFRSSDSDAPVVASAIEYATFNGRLMYVVSLHGSDEAVVRLAALVAPTLAVDPNHPAAVARGR